MSHVTWIGHGTALVELDGVRLLTDPLLRNRVAHLRRRVPPPAADALSGLDAVLLTHLHRDHLDLPSLRQVARRVPIIVPRGGGRLLLRRGFHAVREIAVGEEIAVGALTVQATEARHHGGRGVIGAHGPALGFVIAGTRRIYHAGDTDLFDGMRAIGAAGLDLALVPIWGWGSRLGPGHLDPEGAARALALLEPRQAIPIHWGTYSVGPAARRPPPYLRAPLAEFIAAAHELAAAVDVVPLEPGESLDLDGAA
jgi:L-ascorbate metabolism protein UlaG (beta-lactamase superfamily)